MGWARHICPPSARFIDCVTSGDPSTSLYPPAPPPATLLTQRALPVIRTKPYWVMWLGGTGSRAPWNAFRLACCPVPGGAVQPYNGGERSQCACAALVESGSTLVNNDVAAAAATLECSTSMKLGCFLGHMRCMKLRHERWVGEHNKTVAWRIRLLFIMLRLLRG